MAQLHARHRRGEWCHPRLDPEAGRREAPGRAGELEDARDVTETDALLECLPGPAQEHAPLSGRCQLVPLKAEDGDVPERAAWPVSPDRPVRMGRVLDDSEAVTAGDRHDLGHPGGKTPEVNHDQRAGSRRDASLQIRRIETHPLPFALAEDGDRPEPDHRQDGGPEGGGGDEDLVPGFQIDRLEGGEHGGRPIAVGQSVGHPREASVIPFELPDDRVGRQVAIPENREDRLLVRGREDRPAQGGPVVRGHDRFPAEDRRLARARCHWTSPRTSSNLRRTPAS